MSRLRAAFMGSPDFAVPSLRVVARVCDLRVVVCQPDRPAGRGRKMTAPAVKLAAAELDVPVVQPLKMRDGALHRALAEHDLDVAVVVAFGRILPPDLLALPRHGCINVHGSLLPRWRGAAPIQRAVLAGDATTGVAIMRMDEGLDTGPVYVLQSTPIGALETSGELFDRLADLGARTLEDFLAAFPDVGAARPQPDTGITFAPPLHKDEGRTDFARPIAHVVDHVRGMDPWPGAFTQWNGEALRLFAARPGPAGSEAGSKDGSPATEPGTLLDFADEAMIVACLDGAVAIANVQPAGRSRMTARAWAAGRRVGPGLVLGR